MGRLRVRRAVVTGGALEVGVVGGTSQTVVAFRADSAVTAALQVRKSAVCTRLGRRGAGRTVMSNWTRATPAEATKVVLKKNKRRNILSGGGKIGE